MLLNYDEYWIWRRRSSRRRSNKIISATFFLSIRLFVCLDFFFVFFGWKWNYLITFLFISWYINRWCVPPHSLHIVYTIILNIFPQNHYSCCRACKYCKHLNTHIEILFFSCFFGHCFVSFKNFIQYTYYNITYICKLYWYAWYGAKLLFSVSLIHTDTIFVHLNLKLC